MSTNWGGPFPVVVRALLVLAEALQRAAAAYLVELDDVTLGDLG